jgi:hypothetical protein
MTFMILLLILGGLALLYSAIENTDIVSYVKGYIGGKS